MNNYINTPENGVHAKKTKKYETVEKSTTVGCLADRTRIREKVNAKPWFFSDFELDVICKTVKRNKYGPFMEVLLFTGMRSGEVASLRRSDVDLHKQWITIDGKTWRKIPIPNLLLPTMVKLCNGRSNDDLLLVHNGSRLLSSTLQRWWKSFKQQCQTVAGAKLDKDNKVIPGSSLFDDSHTMRNFRSTYLMNLYSAAVSEVGCAVFMGYKRSDKLYRIIARNEEFLLRMAKKINNYYDARFGSMT